MGQAHIIGTYKADDRSTVRLVEHGGRRWIVKHYHGGPIRTALYHLFRATPAWREVRAATMLAAAGVRVNRPMLLRHLRGRGQSGQLLVLAYAPGRSLYHELFGDAPPDRRDRARQAQRLRIARGVGTQIARMFAAALVNRDHKASNLIVDELARECADGPVLIDPVGVTRSDDMRRFARMLLTLLRSSYAAGGATRRERLTVLLMATRQLEPTRRASHDRAIALMRWLDSELGTPPPKKPDRRPADHPTRQSL